MTNIINVNRLTSEKITIENAALWTPFLLEIDGVVDYGKVVIKLPQYQGGPILLYIKDNYMSYDLVSVIQNKYKFHRYLKKDESVTIYGQF